MTLLTELPINLAQLYFMIYFIRIKMIQRRLTMCEVATLSLIVSVVVLNSLETILFNFVQIWDWEHLNLQSDFNIAWTDIAELFEDVIILVNCIGFLLMCLDVHKKKYSERDSEDRERDDKYV
jgi:hypothetical protein